MTTTKISDRANGDSFFEQIDLNGMLEALDYCQRKASGEIEKLVLADLQEKVAKELEYVNSIK